MWFHLLITAQVLWKCLTTYNTDNNASVFPEPSSFQTTEIIVPSTIDAKTFPSLIPNIIQTIEEIEGENDEEKEEKEEKEVMATETEPDDPNIIQPETDTQEQEQMKKEDIKDEPINN